MSALLLEARVLSAMFLEVNKKKMHLDQPGQFYSRLIRSILKKQPNGSILIFLFAKYFLDIFI